MKVLIADDNEDQLFVRSMLLRQNGFEAFGALDISSAIEVAKTHKPECAVIDLRFPTEDIGLSLIRELRALNSAIHLFLLTGTDPGRVCQRSEADLVDEIVVKGSSSAYLIRKLKALTAG